MQKGIFKKVLALILSVMLVLTAFGGALAVFAEDAEGAEEVAFDYGTFEDGFNTRSESGANDGNPRVWDVPALDAPTNLNWEEGLKYWTSKTDRSGFASDYINLTTADNGENWLSFDLEGNTYDGITTPWFKAPVVEDGTTVRYYIDYMVNAKLTTIVKEAIHPYPVHVTLFQYLDGKETTVYDLSEGPYNNGTNKHGNWNTQRSIEITFNPDALYRIQIQSFIPNDKAAVLDPETGDVITPAVTAMADLKAALDGEDPIFFKNLRFVTENGDGTYTDLSDDERIYVNGQPMGGTEAEGYVVPIWASTFKYMYNTNSSYTTYPLSNSNLYPATEGFLNGDFSQGFKYWTIRFNEGNAANGFHKYDSIDDIFELTDEGAIKFVGSAYAYWGLASTPFILKGLKADDKIRLELDIRNTPEKVNYRFYFGEKGGESSDNYAANTSDAWATRTSKWITVTNDNPEFTIVSQMGTTTTGMELANFKIIKDNGDGTTTDVSTGESYYADGLPVQPFGGTEEDGIIVSNNHFVIDAGGSFDTNDYKFGIADSFPNYDFSQGFKYYSLRYNSSFTNINSLSDYTEITENGTLKFTDFPFGYNGFVTIPFKVEGLKADDELFAAVKLKGNSAGVEVRLYENGTKLNGRNNSTKLTNWGYAYNEARAITSGDSWFAIEVQNMGDNTGMEIDEILILKKNTNRNATNLFTGEEHYDDAVRVGGTYEEGWKLLANGNGNNAINTGSFYGFKGDFSEGLRYWGYQGNVSTAGLCGADGADLKTEDGNTYVTIKDTETEWSGIRTVGLKVDGVKAGDKLTVMFNYRNGSLDNHRIFLGVGNADTSDGIWNLKTDTFASAMIVAENGLWGTAVNKNYITIGEKLGTVNNTGYRYCSTDANEYIWFYFEVECNGANTGGIDLDNFQIVKYIDEYTYETLDGQTITFDAAWAGTFYNGMSGTGNHVNAYVTGYYVENGDFSQGLKYWGATGGAAGSNEFATAHAALVQDGDNNYIQLDNVVRKDYSGFRTPRFNVPAEKLAVGDYVAVAFDLYDPDNTAASFQVVLESVDFTVKGSSTTRPSLTSGNALKVVADKGNGWKTVVTQFTAPIDSESKLANGDWQMRIMVEVKSSNYDAETDTWTTENKSNACFDNFQVVTVERGFGKNGVVVDFDGNAVGEVNVGDANLDGKVDLVDLVRAKKYAAAQAAGESIASPISLASVDTDGVKGIGAADIAAIINKILAA